ncbi:uncharacterized protein LOC128961804 [Oppia nitens]|uniref:uncharacterized protein LOC128961804 n=1 Tax=Oppia nitens TaxID=1686743 RepID=UPI0023DA51EE|nr:uncharacterized protein LOC128961804 [Oppia nitens]
MTKKRSINIEEEVLLKVFELGDGLQFYTQSIAQMVNKSIVINNVSHLLKMISSRDNNSKQFYVIYCDNEVQCRQLCDELGLANCLPHLIIPNIGGVIKFSKRMGDTIIFINTSHK